MSIEYTKPQPLMVGDKAFYTLTSYEPVKARVIVPAVTDDDVKYALATLLMQMGATPEQFYDEQWFAEHFSDVGSPEELLNEIRSELELVNQNFVAEQKADICRAELAKRLVQAVPAAHLARTREAVQMSFEQSLAADGMTIDTFGARTGTSRAQIEHMLDEQARTVSEQEAALDAFARERKLAVEDNELPKLLGLPEEETKNLLAEARKAGQLSAVMDGALRIKTLMLVMAECECEYHHETPEESKARVEEAARLRAQYGDMTSDEDADEPSGFSLV